MLIINSKVQTEIQNSDHNSPEADSSNLSDDEDEFYTPITQDVEYKEYIRESIANKKVSNYF